MPYQKKKAHAQQPQRRTENSVPSNNGDDAAFSPARPFNRKKFFLQLLTVVAVALAIAIGLSIFFKVGTISVAGLNRYQYQTVADASGIQMGDSLLFFSRAEVSSKIMQALPYVKSVRVGISLPGTVNIVIEEVTVTYAIQDSSDRWWLISAGGTVLESTDAIKAEDHTVIHGVVLDNPEVGSPAVAAEQADAGASGVPVTVTAEDRLEAALVILEALERNELLGRFTSVEVSEIYDLQLWYGTDYQFELGDQTQMELKLAYVNSVLDKILRDYPAGTLDVSNPDDSDGFAFKEFSR